jgi:hypothetical protein
MTESARQREAFEAYWRLGPERSIERLREAIKSTRGKAPSMRTLYEWSRQHQWQYRLARLEQEATAAEDEARKAAIREMAERHAKAGVLMQQKGAQWLLEITGDQVTAEAAIRAISEGTKLERLARGEVTDRQEVKSELETRLERFSDEQLEALARGAQRNLDRAGETEA